MIYELVGFGFGLGVVGVAELFLFLVSYFWCGVVWCGVMMVIRGLSWLLLEIDGMVGYIYIDFWIYVYVYIRIYI